VFALGISRISGRRMRHILDNFEVQSFADTGWEAALAAVCRFKADKAKPYST
jgi:hypothetical protein